MPQTQPENKKECFLLFKGWDGPDSAPGLEKVFGTFDDALAYAKELEAIDIKEHIERYKDRQGSSFCWHEERRWNECYKWYQSRAYERFGLSQEDIAADYTDNCEMSDKTIYIERREIE